MGARVIGIGQPTAGDDGVGIVVVDELRRLGPPAGTECLSVKAPASLMPLLLSNEPVILVDAVRAAPAGEVMEIPLAALRRHQVQGLSSHGIGVLQAIELVSVTEPSLMSPDVRIVAVTIDPPRRFVQGLSPEVAGAARRAALRILGLLHEMGI